MIDQRYPPAVSGTRKKLPIIAEVVCRPHNYNNEEIFLVKEKDINSLGHTTWRYQYHVVFAPKYRRMVICSEIKADIGKILRQLCGQRDVGIIAAEACPDHIHMQSVSQIMGYLKGKSRLMIFDHDTSVTAWVKLK